MSVNPMHDYRAYLFMREGAEDFLLAYAKANSPGEMSPFYRERGLEELRKLAAHLGFELVPVSNEKKDAA